MKSLLTLIQTLFLLFMAQMPSSAQQSSIVLKGVQDEYKNLDEIKPVLMNGSDHSIYLLPKECGEANLSLFYMNKDWMPGLNKEYSEDYASIEIKPGESYQIPALVWRPLKTREGKVIERKSFPGRYEISMNYTLETIIEAPMGKPRLKVKEKIMSVRKEFILVP
jgi:hypothetical protein